MRSYRSLVSVALLVLLLTAVGVVAAQQTRTVRGTVLDAKDNALPQAIVYLKNTKTRSVTTYIAGDDGKFSFHSLAPNTDYDLYAEYQGKRSPNRTVSSFDSRSDMTMDLKIPIVK